MKSYFKVAGNLRKNSVAGFTMIEALSVVAVLGIMSAIAGPSWSAFTHLQQLNTAQNQVYRAIRQAQSEAKREKATWQASFRHVEINGQLIAQWSVHRSVSNPSIGIPISSLPPTDPNYYAVNWQNFPDNILIDTELNLKGSRETTLDWADTDRNGSRDVWRVKFDHHGTLDNGIAGQGQITLILQGLEKHADA
ncbi:type II secretion system protein [Geitlerinema splendidum]|nr:type II secretion system protein [Geitlerinema splendidum]